ncbi:MAG: winged helix-turn-helix domain-containing protein [Bacteroidetes bacterium]|nr:winged helix-turn-helix domain-containing protein [Bacteroidota bacterium]
MFLCDFSKIYNSDSFTLPMNRKEMANIFGYSKKSVINTLSKLNKDGILNVNDKKINSNRGKRLSFFYLILRNM